MGARWEEFDLEAAIWRIPPERMKGRKEHVVPLPPQAVDLLRGVQGFTGHRGHVFPNRDNRNMPMTDAALRQASARLGWSGKYSPHATRTTGPLAFAHPTAPTANRNPARASPNALSPPPRGQPTHRRSPCDHPACLIRQYALRNCVECPILYFVINLTIADKKIGTIRNILNPDKLAYIRQHGSAGGEGNHGD